MNNWRLAAGTPVVLLGLMLAACGGGGTGGGGGPISTPPPAPSPSPSPTPTPTPTPVSPTPPSSAAVNDDLLRPLQSESFSNDAARGAAVVQSTGSVVGTAQLATVSIEFDAATGNYVVTRAGRQQTFRPTDRNAGLSGPALDVFVRDSGTVTDSLSLTTPSEVGAGRYRYVGGGVWQETTGTTGGSVNVVAYGVETLDNDLPRAGAARYEVTLLGAGAWQQKVTALSGLGSVNVDFAGGTLTGQGTASERDVTDGTPAGNGSWSLTATLASATNDIDGTVTLVGASGPFSGRFYGPSGVELGGVFAATGTHPAWGQGAATGVLLGYRSSDTGLNASFAEFRFPQAFDARGWGLLFKYDQATGQAEQTVGYLPNVFGDRLSYDPAAGVFSVGGMNGQFSPVALATPEPGNDRFAAYSGVSGDTTVTLRQYRYAGNNPEVQLTYASFARYTATRPESSAGVTYLRVTDFWPVYGFPTPQSGRPATGNASYAGVLYGSALDGTGSNVIQAVNGTVALAMNFAQGTLGGNFHFFVTDPGGVQHDFGNIAVAGGSIERGFNVNPEFRGSLGDGVQGQTGGPRYIGATFNGGFYGPTGQEVAGMFNGRYAPIGSNALSGYIYGAFAAKQGGSTP